MADTITGPAQVGDAITGPAEAASEDPAATNGGGSDGPAPNQRLPWVRPVLVGVILVAAVTAAIATYHAVAAATSFPGQVEANSAINLNFPNAGVLSAVHVQPGQRVTKGEVLAQENPSLTRATLAADQAVVAADQAQLTVMQGPYLNPAVSQQLSLEISQAQSALKNAQTAASDATSVATSSVQSTQATIASDSNIVNQDQAAFTAACPSGVVPPPEQTAPSSGTPPDSPMQAYLNCQNLQTLLQKDSAVYSDAQAELPHQQSLANQMQDVATGAVNNAQLAVSIAENQPAVTSILASPAGIAAQQVVLEKDQAQVVKDQSYLSQLDVTSPVDGIVTAVGGAVGDIADALGVRVYLGLPSQASPPPGFTLLPQITTTQNQQPQELPVVTIEATGRHEVVAQIDENSLVSMHRGESVTITFNALGISMPGRFQRVVPVPVVNTSPSVYDVVFSLRRWPRGVLPGMSIGVSVG